MHLKDSLSGELLPVKPSFVSIYACGITPYSSAHVGHARTYVVFDLLANVLRAEGHSVHLVRNITDIDDKIIAVANKEGVTWRDISTKYADENRALMQATGLTVPDEPKASDYLEDIFWITQALITKDLAYVSSTGDVLYRVSAYAGQLLMNHKAGTLRSEQGETRVNQAGKEDLRDFALWKRVPDTEPGFASPWGHGRPGWHIECSAMIKSLFGGSVTIHGGGVDLKFPHHQAEIMQSEPVFGAALADIWMYNGSVLSDGKKMSKSLNNFVTWQAALTTAEALVPGLGADLLRISLLQAHWQKPLDWSDKLLFTTKTDLLQLTQGLEQVPATNNQAFMAQLRTNLNFPSAMVKLKQQRKQGNLGGVVAALEFLGVNVSAWASFKEQKLQGALTDAEIKDLLAQREQARQDKNWARADELRDLIQQSGVHLKDTKAK